MVRIQGIQPGKRDKGILYSQGRGTRDGGQGTGDKGRGTRDGGQGNSQLFVEGVEVVEGVEKWDCCLGLSLVPSPSSLAVYPAVLSPQLMSRQIYKNIFQISSFVFFLFFKS